MGNRRNACVSNFGNPKRFAKEKTPTSNVQSLSSKRREVSRLYKHIFITPDFSPGTAIDAMLASQTLAILEGLPKRKLQRLMSKVYRPKDAKYRVSTMLPHNKLVRISKTRT
jgi:hypothetical protein